MGSAVRWYFRLALFLAFIALAQSLLHQGVGL